MASDNGAVLVGDAGQIWGQEWPSTGRASRLKASSTRTCVMCCHFSPPATTTHLWVFGFKVYFPVSLCRLIAFYSVTFYRPQIHLSSHLVCSTQRSATHHKHVEWIPPLPRVRHLHFSLSPSFQLNNEVRDPSTWSGSRDNRAVFSGNLCSCFHLTQWKMIQTGILALRK